MALLGYIIGKTVIVTVAGISGFIVGGPVGAGIAISQVCVATGVTEIVLLTSPL